MDIYSHQALPSNSGHIRLLHLLPRADDLGNPNDIECELFPARLGGETVYDALSYCWGAPEKPYNISIRGKRMPITANLHAALVRLLNTGHDTLTFVDAVCINQEDTAEKSQQVAQMGSVYRQARCVISWLGPAEQDSDQALKWIQKVGQKATQLRLRSMSEVELRASIDQKVVPAGNWRPPSSGPISQDAMITRLGGAEPGRSGSVNMLSLFDECRTSLSGSSASRGLRDALEHFLWRNYWQRAWPIQEVCNAQNVRFLCGDMEVNEATLVAALTLLQLLHDHGFRNEHSLLFPEYGSFRAIAILRIRQLLSKGYSLPLMYLLRHFRRSKSTLKVDIIYSLLGMATDFEELRIAPDYSLDDRQGLIEVAQALLKAGHVEILSRCNTRNRMPGLPSWVPDWGELGVQAFLCQRGMVESTRTTAPQPNFKAGSGLPFMLQRTFQTQQETISLAALCLGPIEELGRPFDSRRASQWLEDLLRLCPEEGSGVSPSLYIACKTAVTDQQSDISEEKPRADPRILEETCRSISPNWPEDLLGLLRSNSLGEVAAQIERKARKRLPMRIGNAYVGLAPEHAEVGDEVYIVAGASVPYIFRKDGVRSVFTLIGEAYVHGVMDGEALTSRPSQMETISVI